MPAGGAGFRVVGDDVDQVIAGVAYRRTARISNGLFMVEASGRSVATEFPASEAKSAQQALRALAKTTVHVKRPSSWPRTVEDLESDLEKTPKTAADFIHRAEKQVKLKPESALADYGEAIKLEPKNVPALTGRALLRLQKGDAAVARQDLDLAYAVEPTDPALTLARIQAAPNPGDKPDAAIVAELERTLQVWPEDRTLRLARASYLTISRSTQAQALTETQAVIRDWPAAVQAYRLSAGIDPRNRKAEIAAEAAALRKHAADDPAGLMAAAQIFSSVDMRTEALEAATLALEIGPQVEEGYMMRADMRAQDDLDGRRADIDTALKINPRAWRALVTRSQLETRTRDFGKAAATLSEALAANPDDAALAQSSRDRVSEGG